MVRVLFIIGIVLSASIVLAETDEEFMRKECSASAVIASKIAEESIRRGIHPVNTDAFTRFTKKFAKENGRTLDYIASFVANVSPYMKTEHVGPYLGWVCFNGFNDRVVYGLASDYGKECATTSRNEAISCFENLMTKYEKKYEQMDEKDKAALREEVKKRGMN